MRYTSLEVRTTTFRLNPAHVDGFDIRTVQNMEQAPQHPMLTSLNSCSVTSRVECGSSAPPAPPLAHCCFSSLTTTARFPSDAFSDGE